METEINGVTCTINVTHYYTGAEAKLYGEPEDCAPEEPEEIEYSLLDESGREIELAMSVSDEARVEDLIRESFDET